MSTFSEFQYNVLKTIVLSMILFLFYLIKKQKQKVYFCICTFFLTGKVYFQAIESARVLKKNILNLEFPDLMHQCMDS